MSKPLDRLFRPQSVAVLGASPQPEKLGHVLLKNLVDYGYTGRIYPVNSRGETVLGRPGYRNIRDVGEAVDLALISIPNVHVPQAIRDCAAAGVGVAIILSSGFGETGAEGQSIQAEMRSVAHAAGMRIVGPNCMGVYNPGLPLNGSYFWTLPRTVGRISFVSQSGAMGGLFFAEAGARGFGCAKFLSVGNTCDLDHADALAYLADDPDTAVIGLFIEGLRDGRRFCDIARRVTPVKPVVVLKGGRTGAGTRAAASHTGSMAGTAQVYRAAMEAAGVLWATSAEEFWDMLVALEAHGGRLPRGNRLAIITISGGPSVLSADACEEQGLVVPPLPDQTRAAIAALTPDFAATGNPVDLTPQCDPANVAPAIEQVVAGDTVDGALLINLGLDWPGFHEGVRIAQEKYGKPVLALVSAVPQMQAAFAELGVPNFPAPERAVAGYRSLVRYREARERLAAGAAAAGGGATASGAAATAPGAAAVPAPAPSLTGAAAGAALDEYDSKRALAHFGLPVTREERVTSLADAAAAAGRIGYPVALKICRADVAHKSDRGGVKLGITDPAALEQAWRELSGQFGDGPYLVQEMVAGGSEWIAGAKYDPTFGHLILFGPGGVLVELLGEAALAPAPLDLPAAVRLVQYTRAARLLQGYRGAAAVPVAAVARCLVAVSDLVTAHPEIAEVDVNPLIARPDGVRAVDALVVLRA